MSCCSKHLCVFLDGVSSVELRARPAASGQHLIKGPQQLHHTLLSNTPSLQSRSKGAAAGELFPQHQNSIVCQQHLPSSRTTVLQHNSCAILTRYPLVYKIVRVHSPLQRGCTSTYRHTEPALKVCMPLTSIYVSSLVRFSVLHAQTIIAKLQPPRAPPDLSSVLPRC